MEEMKNGMNHSQCNSCNMGMNNCRCMMCYGTGHRHMILRWILGIVILAITFNLGMKLGEFKGSFEGSSYGGGYGYYSHGHNRGNMMYRGQQFYPLHMMMSQTGGFPQSIPTHSTLPSK